jgi:tetratricopeptide (TPR) repeat protein
MKITAFLAEQALAHEDGSLYITSGFLERVQYPAYPISRAQLAVAVHVLVAPEEIRASYVLTVDVRGVTNEVILGPAAVMLDAHPNGPKSADGELVLNCVLGLRDILLREPGVYRFLVRIDQSETVELKLLADIGPNPRRVVLQANPAAAQIRERQEAVAAFAAGDIDGAGGLFEKLRVQHPGDPDLANSLGFIRLSQNRIDEALSLFDESEHLGYSEPAILLSNRGAASYLAGRYLEANELFRHSLGARLVSSQLWLALITDSGIEPVFLNDVGEFLVLNLLNSAWAAYRSGEPGITNADALASMVAEVGDETSRTRFQASLSAMAAAR